LLPIAVIHPSDELIWKAAEIKADHPMSLADCFTTATAMENNATIITGDPEFKHVEHLVEIEWI
ncbi:MAG: PIN domain-containing protein, partial [bacterium]